MARSDLFRTESGDMARRREQAEARQNDARRRNLAKARARKKEYAQSRILQDQLAAEYNESMYRTWLVHALARRETTYSSNGCQREQDCLIHARRAAALGIFTITEEWYPRTNETRYHITLAGCTENGTTDTPRLSDRQIQLED